MTKRHIALIVGVLVLVAAGTAISQQAEDTTLLRHGILSLLRKGQPISVKDCGFNYELTVYEGETAATPLGHTVLQVTSDYVLLRDLAGVTDTAIPVSSIKALATFRIPKKKSAR